MIRAAEAEIVALHAFFEGWLGGSLPDSDEVFERVARALAPGFELVTPEGRTLARGALLADLRAGHGGQPGLTIRTREVQAGELGPGLVLVGYQEWQQAQGAPRGRISTALLRSAPDAPGGVEWLHLHETWLPR